MVQKLGGTKIVRVDLRSIFLPSNLFTVLCFPPGLNHCIFLSPVAHATGMTMPRVSSPDEAYKLQAWHDHVMDITSSFDLDNIAIVPLDQIAQGFVVDIGVQIAHSAVTHQHKK